MADKSFVERVFERGQMQIGDIFIGDDRTGRPRREPADMVSRFRDQPRANQDRIGPRPKLHADARLARKILRAGAWWPARIRTSSWACERRPVGRKSQN